MRPWDWVCPSHAYVYFPSTIMIPTVRASAALRAPLRAVMLAPPSIRAFSTSIVRRRIEENISGERLAQLLQEQSAKPLLVDFVAEWCGPCKMLSPVLHKLASSPDLVGGKDIDLVTIDVDHEIGAAQKYGVRAMPTVIAFKDGRPVSQFVGVLPEGQLRQFIQGL